MVKKIDYVWAILRMSMGLIFLWAFLDKVFGLGFTTTRDKSWISGTSPTFGFLKLGTKGPFSSFYQNIAGNPLVDWIFMIGLLLIGITLILGISVKIAGYSGALMLVLMWTAVLPPEHHPFLDEHIIYMIIMIGLTITNSGEVLGIGKWWGSLDTVKKYRFLK